MNFKRKLTAGLCLLSLFFLASCHSPKEKRTVQDDVTIQIGADPGILNPINAQSNTAGQIMGQIIQTLTSIDFKSLKEVPVLVKSRPKIENITDGPFKGGVKLTYEFRPDVKWDNGKPVTVEDILFSVKAIMNPAGNADAMKSLFDEIDSIGYDNPEGTIFTIYNKHATINTEENNGSIPVLPEYYYDPNHLLRKYSISYVRNQKNADKITKNPDFIKFTEAFNSEKLNGVNTCGSGAYKIKEYVPNQRVVLERKKPWWADKIMTENTAMEAYPEHITYKVINDPAAVITELKAGKIDAASQIASKDFIQLQNDTHFTSRYYLHSPPDFTYCFIGMNLKNPILSDLNVRRAFAHLLDIDGYIKTILYGLGYPTTSMEHPSKKDEYNSDIKRLSYDPAEAKKLLEEAGWKDMNGDGMLDKKINGKMTPLKLTLLVNKGNAVRAQIAEIFKNEAAKIGVDINVEVMDLNLMTKNEISHNFEMGFCAWQGVPLHTDPKGTWASESANGGRNILSFGDAESDRLIDSIRTEMNDEKRIRLYKRFQALVYDRMPCLFLYAYKGKVIISKRFANAEPSGLRPGYNEAGFKLKE